MTQTQTENGLDKTEKLGRIKLKCIKKTKSSMQINWIHSKLVIFQINCPFRITVYELYNLIQQ